MNFKSMEEIIRFAIEKEEEAAAFYKEAAGQESFKGIQKTLEEFSAEELKHKALLEAFLTGERTLPDYELKWITDIKRSNYITEFDYESGMSYPDILRLAMKREEKALNLYNDLMGNTDQKDFVKLFKMLAQEEAKHKLTLETIYDDFMAEQGD
ncbi:MAG TPA: ferritin family protein [Deltaproteobacteria bacterium]|nr:ferritin family protein [Deltaproteobacteria bacterium]HIJ41945.1 ferritin family protein [Deltaproteobacteria bacterium]